MRSRFIRYAKRPFAYILVTFLVFRLMVAWLTRPGGYLVTMSDFNVYYHLASYASQGFHPLVDYWVEYPPPFPWISVGVYRLSLLLPNWGGPRTWFYILMASFFALAETANLLLLYLIGKRLHGRGAALRIAWLYSLLFLPLLTMLGRFDVFVLTFLLLALYLTLAQRHLASSAVAGLGFMVKISPLIVVPVAFWRARTWRRRVLLVAVTLLTLIVVALPFILLNPELFTLSWTINLKRGSWETVWALLEGFTGYGLPGGANRFDPAEAGAHQHPSTLPWGLISAGFALVYLYLWLAARDKVVSDDPTTREPRSTAFRTVAFTGLTINLVSLYLKGFSPQFIVWLLPFVLLLLPDLRGVVYALLLSAANLVESPLYFTMLPDQTWLLTGAVLARTGLLVMLAVEYGRMALAQPISRRWSRRLCLGAAALLIALGLVAVPFAYDAYYQSQLALSPHREAIETLRAEARPGALLVVGGDEPSNAQGAFDAIYPFLQRHFDVTSIQTDWWFPGWAPRLADAVAGREQVWLYAPADSPLHGWLAERYQPLVRHEFGSWLLSGWLLDIGE